MKATTSCVVIVTLLVLSAPSTQGQSELVLTQTVGPGVSKQYDHADGIVLADGFWAKAGSDFTATITQTSGFSIDKTPLDPKDGRYTSTDTRTFVVAGCVPMTKATLWSIIKHFPKTGSSWIQGGRKQIHLLPRPPRERHAPGTFPQGSQHPHVAVVPVLVSKPPAGRHDGFRAAEGRFPVQFREGGETV